MGSSTQIKHQDKKVEELKEGQETLSLCSHCKKLVKAEIRFESKQVWMKKHCHEHGVHRELISSDLSFFKKQHSVQFMYSKHALEPIVPDGKTCPDDCGVCNLHRGQTSLAKIDLSNRCDMSCPTCYSRANEHSYVSEPNEIEVRRMLHTIKKANAGKCPKVQFSGGEPTLHPKFHRMCKIASEMGFKKIQVETNGKRFSHFEFMQKAKESGLTHIYLQFDTLDSKVDFHLRGEKTIEKKLRVIEHSKSLGLKVVLVVMVASEINTLELVDVIEFAKKNTDVIEGVSFRLVSKAGRVDETHAKTLTLSDVAQHLNLQVDGLTQDSWVSLGCDSSFENLNKGLSVSSSGNYCHPDCGMGSFLLIDSHQRAYALSSFFNIRQALQQLNYISEDKNSNSIKTLLMNVKRLFTLRKHFYASKSPKGWAFNDFIRLLKNGFKENQPARMSLLSLEVINFHDERNFDVERAKRCTVHYSASNGSIYPAATYNGGPYYRELVERVSGREMQEYMIGASENEPAAYLDPFPTSINLPMV